MEIEVDIQLLPGELTLFPLKTQFFPHRTVCITAILLDLPGGLCWGLGGIKLTHDRGIFVVPHRLRS
jgi:hypothetical protein